MDLILQFSLISTAVSYVVVLNSLFWVKALLRITGEARYISKWLLSFSSVLCSLLQSRLTVCSPMTAARQASLSFTISWSLLKLMSADSVVPSNHLKGFFSNSYCENPVGLLEVKQNGVLPKMGLSGVFSSQVCSPCEPLAVHPLQSSCLHPSTDSHRSLCFGDSGLESCDSLYLLVSPIPAQWFVPWPQFSQGYKRSCWFSVHIFSCWVDGSNNFQAPYVVVQKQEILQALFQWDLFSFSTTFILYCSFSLFLPSCSAILLWYYSATQNLIWITALF